MQENTGSPNKMRRLAQQTIRLPIPFYLQRLPDSEDVTLTSLLAWHAGEMVRKNGWQDNPKRKRFKTGVSLEDYCISLSMNPLCSITMPVVTGKERVYASHIAAKVFSTAFDWSVRRGRECVSGLWPSTPADVKNKWWFSSPTKSTMTSGMRVAPRRLSRQHRRQSSAMERCSRGKRHLAAAATGFVPWSPADAQVRENSGEWSAASARNEKLHALLQRWLNAVAGRAFVLFRRLRA